MDPRWRQLQELAIRQHGHFTTSQAEAAGLTRPAIHYQLREGRLERPERGVYRFTAYPPTDHEREAVLMLWSRLDPAVAFSHESALRHRSEEHTSELQSRGHLVCRLLLEKKKK